MITSINLKNFKSHKDTHLKLSNLNILTGFNYSGKSSIIESLLLLRQTYLKGEPLIKKGLLMIGDLIDVGSCQEIFHINSDIKDPIEFNLISDNKYNLNWKFDYEYNSNFLNLKKYNFQKKIDNINLFNEKFQYINPKNIIKPKTINKCFHSNTINMLNQISEFNGTCDNITYFFEKFKSKTIPNKLLHHYKSKNKYLSNEVQTWLNDFYPNLSIEISTEKLFSKLLVLDLKYNNHQFYLNRNIFYILSILTAILSATKDTLILIENLEYYLHPNIQSKLIKLINTATQFGIQFIITTNSEHIINETSILIKESKINKNNIKLYFFNNINNFTSEIIDIPILKIEESIKTIIKNSLIINQI